MLHHLAALVATAVDLGMMVALVEGVGMSPVTATAIGATAGGITNYGFGRRFTYRAPKAGGSARIGRYALVSAASMGLNTLGENWVVGASPTHYLLGRILVAFVVSNAWNYPMQKFFVFAPRRSGLADAR
jgi:putative flippase GtrA